MATLATLKVGAGTFNPDTVVNVAAAADQDFINGEGVTLWVLNGSAGSINVTIPKAQDTINVPGTGEVAIADIVVAVPAGKLRGIRVPLQGYADPENENKVAVNWSATTTVTARVTQFIKF